MTSTANFFVQPPAPPFLLLLLLISHVQATSVSKHLQFRSSPPPISSTQRRSNSSSATKVASPQTVNVNNHFPTKATSEAQGWIYAFEKTRNEVHCLPSRGPGSLGWIRIRNTDGWTKWVCRCEAARLRQGAFSVQNLEYSSRHSVG
ncbi:hypothetical protein GALMADRAFT_227163 [Galerina marginata CBS 339.88]|uniref:Uncharacterized protein n=1 Tax=Galerina marginata (strain CBS 339.88) TaxID=685588 RepID=A0A067SUZ6_GALM3|nr:hypothetical protein GALMADRAFT_227163 [Galerina marginata CBS 339.88]